MLLIRSKNANSMPGFKDSTKYLAVHVLVGRRWRQWYCLLSGRKGSQRLIWKRYLHRDANVAKYKVLHMQTHIANNVDSKWPKVAKHIQNMAKESFVLMQKMIQSPSTFFLTNLPSHARPDFMAVAKPSLVKSALGRQEKWQAPHFCWVGRSQITHHPKKNARSLILS